MPSILPSLVFDWAEMSTAMCLPGGGDIPIRIRDTSSLPSAVTSILYIILAMTAVVPGLLLALHPPLLFFHSSTQLNTKQLVHQEDINLSQLIIHSLIVTLTTQRKETMASPIPIASFGNNSQVAQDIRLKLLPEYDSKSPPISPYERKPN